MGDWLMQHFHPNQMDMPYDNCTRMHDIMSQARLHRVMFQAQKVEFWEHSAEEAFDRGSVMVDGQFDGGCDCRD